MVKSQSISALSAPGPGAPFSAADWTRNNETPGALLAVASDVVTVPAPENMTLGEPTRSSAILLTPAFTVPKVPDVKDPIEAVEKVFSTNILYDPPPNPRLSVDP
uniref:Uncharacterized protein n=1 Tax=Compsopogon caeruleus TaxID=31354 RepID=A0A7S1T7D7_9RHOD